MLDFFKVTERGKNVDFSLSLPDRKHAGHDNIQWEEITLDNIWKTTLDLQSFYKDQFVMSICRS